jgi:pimeloyl-ACP methyl ester carboxylesterase
MSADMPPPPATLAVRTFNSPRQKTCYLEAGPARGPLMMLLHGWPEIGLMWHAQIDAFVADGWHCIAPDLRGYGGSSAPPATDAYTLKEIVQDMVELHDHLGGERAIWVGHDWGSTVAGTFAAHYPARTRAVVFISLPYLPGSFALPTLVPLIDRQLYPADKYPYGQWDYFRFYQTNFDSAVADLNADIPATLASIFRSGNPAARGKLSPSANTTANGGRYGAAHRAPPTEPDPALWPAADFNALVAAFRVTGFRPATAWYLNDGANMAYAHSADNGGRLNMPALFINCEYDQFTNITGNHFGDPMRAACAKLSVANIPSGHWAPLERKAETITAAREWLQANGLAARADADARR